MTKYLILVEGVADEVFMKAYIKKIGLEEGLVTTKSCDGYTNIKKQAFINELKKNTDNGGMNLVVFDADGDCQSRRKELTEIKDEIKVDFDIFLFPNDSDPGALENLLEKIINPDNQCILDCWNNYEKELSKCRIPWKNPQTPTTPAYKTKIYGYLEALTGTTKEEKKKIKEKERDYLDSNLWNLDSDYLYPLKSFLLNHIKP
jgi:hypothetical protein